MDPFVRRLIERMHDPAAGLSRNRHFHTFSNPQGQVALRISKRLKALRADIVRCSAEGRRPVARAQRGPGGEVRVELVLERLHARRVTWLDRDEYELLCALPGVGEAVAQES